MTNCILSALRKGNKENFSADGWCPGRDLNRVPPKQIPEALMLQSAHSVREREVSPKTRGCVRFCI
jgi:hypothetical protein